MHENDFLLHGILLSVAWIIDNQCTSLKLQEQQSGNMKSRTKLATNGQYQFSVLLSCDAGDLPQMI